MRRTRVVFVFCGVFAAVLLLNVQARAPQKAQIAFASKEDGNWEIYVMDVDGRHPRNITNHFDYDHSPAWLPDGRIAFVSNLDNGGIYAMDADGSDVVKLAELPPRCCTPALSPDCEKIVFYSYQGGQNDIRVMDFDGGNVRQLTNNARDDVYPTWSPDGRKIAFVSTRNRDRHWCIYVMDSDGQNIQQLTTHPAPDFDPAWSPDGRQIAFTSHRVDQTYKKRNIYVIDADGQNVRRLTNHAARDGEPAWSPDGRHIVFSAGRTGELSIYVVDADGQNLRELTKHRSSNCSPAWFDPAVAFSVSPAGKYPAKWGWLKHINR